MKKIWNAISKKDLIFGIIIFALVILISIFRPSENVKVAFGEDAVDIKSTQYSMNIPYEMVSHLELTDVPELGENVDGYNNNVIQTGQWRNDVWGDYHSCLDLMSETCIVIHLNDGRTFVISRTDNEETAKVFEEFQTYLNP